MYVTAYLNSEESCMCEIFYTGSSALWICWALWTRLLTLYMLYRIKLYIGLFLIILCRHECQTSNNCFVPFLTKCFQMVFFSCIFSILWSTWSTWALANLFTNRAAMLQLNPFQHFFKALNFNVLICIQSLLPFFLQILRHLLKRYEWKRKWIVNTNITHHWRPMLNHFWWAG